MRNDERILLDMTVHDKGGYLSNVGNLFGNAHVMQFVKPNVTIKSNTYEVKRQRITELNRYSKWRLSIEGLH